MIPIIKVLVVDDSALIRQILTRALSLDPRIEIVGTARDGVEAIERAKELQPDVITLDIEMPMLNGLEALPFLIRETPARVIMLTSIDDPSTTYEALDGGAVDFIVKPRGGFATSISDLADVLIKQIKTAYRISPEKRTDRAMKLVQGLVEGSNGAGHAIHISPPAGLRRVVAVAASTGGPPALERVFSGLSADLPAAYVVVQHLPAGFASSLVERLGRVSDIQFVQGTPNAQLKPGTAYVAPHGSHMVVSRRGTIGRLRMEDGPTIHGVRPSADPLIESVAREYGTEAVGVVLTGMGSDGADGLVAINGSGGTTIVQDEASSVVWGMPGAAVKRGAAQHILPLDEVAAQIRRAVGEGD
jgi:two-component system, chemotaxis family, protein-glutamate methylesterase/glutaminase